MRRLLTIMALGLALLLAPAGPATAGAPAPGHEMMTAMADHCAERGSEPTSKDMGMDCCVATCAATAATIGETAFAAIHDGGAVERPAPDSFLRSIHAKLPTPPPRAA